MSDKRTLIYVPIIHTAADLGSLAKAVTVRGMVDLGEEVWHEHLKTIERFWGSIARYFDPIDVRGIKVYQDGMVANKEVGQEIVKEGVKSGSKNYEVVSRLLDRGAILVKTENFNLVKQEHGRLRAIIQSKSLTQKLAAFMKYKLTKHRLLNRRDRFIAKRINETLNQGEKGILFIGAYHDIKRYLPRDIDVTQIKDLEMVSEYQRLLPFYNKNKERIERLAKYLVSEIEYEKN